MSTMSPVAKSQDDQKQEEEKEPIVSRELQETGKNKKKKVLQDSLDEKFNAFTVARISWLLWGFPTVQPPPHIWGVCGTLYFGWSKK